MKIGYIINHPLVSTQGVTRKVFEQTRTWKLLGHEVLIFSLNKIDNNLINSNDVKIINYIDNSLYKKRFKINKSFLADINNYKPDLLYVRYDLWQKNYDILFKKYITVVEIQTNDYSEMKLLSKNNIKGLLSYIFFLIFRDRFFQNVDAMVTVTNELARLPIYMKYKKPICVIPNGIDLMKYEIIKNENDIGNIIKLFFIGSPNLPWHGLDIIENIAEKIKDFEFHIIGTNSKKENVKNLFYHGILNEDSYVYLLKNAHICIGTLALFRKKMNEACPLKVREYLARGFPVIIGYEDTSFLDKKPNFILKLNFIDGVKTEQINEIRAFTKANKYRIVNKNEILHIDIKNLETKRLLFFNRVLNKNNN